jgi:hypothetical protein
MLQLMALQSTDATNAAITATRIIISGRLFMCLNSFNSMRTF